MANPAPSPGQELLQGAGLPTVIAPATSTGLYLGQLYENTLTGDLYVLRCVAAGDPAVRTNWQWVPLATTGGVSPFTPVNIQRGTSVLVDNVSAAIPATITATSRILVSRMDPLGTTIGQLCVKAADRTVGVAGAGGQFLVRSVDAAGVASTDDDSTFDWVVIN